MIRRLAIVLAAGAVVACGDDDEPTGPSLDDLADVPGMTFELSGIGTISGYRDLAPGTLGTGDCPGQAGLREETEFREAELSFTDDTWVMELRVRSYCYDPEAEVIVPDFGPIVTEQFSGGYTIEGDHIPLGSTSYGFASAHLEEGGLRVEFAPGSINVASGIVLLFE